MQEMMISHIEKVLFPLVGAQLGYAIQRRLSALVILLSFIIIAPGVVHAQNSSDILVVELLDGVETISLGRQPVISFESGCLVVSTSEASITMNYGYERIKRVYLTTQGEFIDNDPVGPVTRTDETQQQSFQRHFSYINGHVIIEGADTGCKVQLFTADGRRLSAPVQYGEQTEIDLTALPVGLVIISLNGHSYKIMKK